MSRNFLTPLVLPAGTASSAPLTLQSGTNLTTAAAGAMEYDGKAFYTTPAARGVSPSMMYYRLNSNRVGSNATGAQSLLGVGATLDASTVYAFEYYCLLQKTAGTTSHTIGSSIGGTATVNNINYNLSWSRENAAAASSAMTSFSAYLGYATSVSNFVITGTIISANQTFCALAKGTVSINAGGTFIPQYTLSSAPGGAYSTIAGSYFAIWPIGAAGAAVSVGPWA